MTLGEKRLEPNLPADLDMILGGCRDVGKKELVTVSVHFFKHFKLPNLAV